MTTMQASDYLLFYRARNPAPYTVDETLGVNAAGWVFHQRAAASSTSRRDQAGSYAAELPADLNRHAADLASSLADLTPDDTAVFRRAIQFTVTSSAAERPVTHALHRVPPEQLPGPAREALELYSALLNAVESAPFAVVQLSARLTSPPARGVSPERTRLMLHVHNPGTHQVNFIFQVDSFQLAARGPEGLKLLWQSGAERLTGFVNPEAQLVDGIRAPAGLAQGEGAALLIPLPIEIPESVPLQVTANGRIKLVVPGVKTTGEPDTEMSLLCELAGRK